MTDGKHKVRGDARIALSLLQGPLSVRRGGLEAAVDAGPDLSESRIAASLELAREHMARGARGGGGLESFAPEISEAQDRVLGAAEQGLRKLAQEGDRAELTREEYGGLEAIIVADGSRPSLFVQDDKVDPDVPQAGTWKPLIEPMQEAIRTVARSVGRINVRSPWYPSGVGTGFVVAPGLIMTNRHVLEPIAFPADGGWRFKFAGTAIDFAAERDRARERTFAITGVRFAGPEAINDRLERPPRKLDMALLEVATDNGQEALPAALPVSLDVPVLSSHLEVYLMGFPAKPRSDYETTEVLQQVFGPQDYSVKRFAPGYILAGPDTVDDGGHHRVIVHECSTLGGNSGSCIIDFRTGGTAVGLHFGGVKREENFAHALARLQDILIQHGASLVA